MASDHGAQKATFSSTEGQLLIAGFCAVSALFIALVVIVSKLDDQIIALPTLSIAGIVLLLISLAAIAYVFVRTGLQDPKQALGLPAGSIQAVIALSLIVLFAILSVFIFTSMGPASQRKITNLSQTDRDAQMAALSNAFAGWEKAADNTYTIYVRDPGIDARNDVGKQLIVLIGTLMTSAVSFYFGSRATLAGTNPPADGDGGQGGGSATIGRVEPAQLPLGETTRVTIGGTGLARTSAVVFRQEGAAPLAAALVSASETQVVCSVEVPLDAAAGDYEATLTVGGASVVKPAALKLVG